jgi:branched-chain amino acid aminotransferase
LNTKGFVAETTVSNLFIVDDGRIFTPPIEDGALPGVMRAAVMAACKCMEKPLEPNDIYLADGIFLTNSLGIRTVASLDGKPTSNAARAFMEDIRIKLTA